MKSLTKLFPYLKPHWRLILISLVLAIPMAALRSSPVVLVKQLIDDLLVSRDPHKLVTVPLLVIGVFIANFVVRFIHYYSLRIVVARVEQKLKNDLFGHLMGLSADYFTTKSSGEMISRVGSDPIFIGQGVWQVNSVVREPVQLIILIGTVFYIDWRLSLITIAIFPPLIAIFSVSGKAVKRYIQKMQEEQGRMYGTLQESFTGFRIIKAFKLESYVTGRFFRQTDVFAKHLLKTAIYEETSHPMVELVTAIAVAALVYVGGGRVLSGHLTQGELISFFTAFALMTNPIRSLNEINLKLNAAAGASERINDLFSWTSRIVEKSPPAQPVEFKSDIVFKDVHFSYPDEPSREILSGIDFRLEKGKSVALVGASGAGKSSLVTLLPRIYDITSGSIQIDGIEVRDFEIARLREWVSVVSQDVFLFNDTIEENIRCGRLDATFEEIVDAAKQAHAYDFIQTLPQGFATVIGDRGQKLSGGERQRVSIARAFLRRSPILILDEATSALDSRSELSVQNALEKLMQNRTVIMIAHRLSTVRNADEILVMDQGKIIERGTHLQLLRAGGTYSKMVSLTEGSSATT